MKTFTPRRARAAAFALAPLLLLAATAVRPQSPAPPPTEGRAVTVVLTAVGRDGKAVKTLKAEDLSVEEDGAARPVTKLEHRADLPLVLAIGLDTSQSQQRVIDGTKMAADELVRSVMRPGTDHAAVFSFTHEATLEQELTSDAAKVRAGIARVKVSGAPMGLWGTVVTGPVPKGPVNLPGTTAVWEAVAAVCDDLLSQTSRPGRRAIVLITDGVDTSSTAKLDDAVRTAIQTGAAVYPIGIGDTAEYDGVDRGDLRKLAERTGGRAFFPKKVKNLPEVFAQLREELFSAYALTFASAYTRPDGSFRKLKVKVAGAGARKSGVEVAFPHGHFAGNALVPLK